MYDAMRLITKYGKPDFFITMTANPEWKEVVSLMAQGYNKQIAIARVFNLKKNQLLRDIQHNGILGMYVAHVGTIQHQNVVYHIFTYWLLLITTIHRTIQISFINLYLREYQTRMLTLTFTS